MSDAISRALGNMFAGRPANEEQREHVRQERSRARIAERGRVQDLVDEHLDLPLGDRPHRLRLYKTRASAATAMKRYAPEVEDDSEAYAHRFDGGHGVIERGEVYGKDADVVITACWLEVHKVADEGFVIVRALRLTPASEMPGR